MWQYAALFVLQLMSSTYTTHLLISDTNMFQFTLSGLFSFAGLRRCPTIWDAVGGTLASATPSAVGPVQLCCFEALFHFTVLLQQLMCDVD